MRSIFKSAVDATVLSNQLGQIAATRALTDAADGAEASGALALGSTTDHRLLLNTTGTRLVADESSSDGEDAGPAKEHVVRSAQALWSNVELFEGWPAPCEFPTKCGRHPAPIERIVKQLASEDPFVEGRHVAWEWATCLSPWTNANTSRLYADYALYVGANISGYPSGIANTPSRVH